MKLNLIHIYSSIIIIISLIYGFLVSSGFYGYNIDYYVEYSRNNLVYPFILDRLGSLLSTLHVFGFSVGLYLTSFTLSLSSGFFIKKCFRINLANKTFSQNNYKFFLIFLFIYLITLHIHPIIMSTSGAMRQGWVMSFVFFSLTLIFYEKFLLSFFFILIATVMHKSGIIYFYYLVSTFLVYKILKKFTYNKLILLFFFGCIFFLINLFIFFQIKIYKFDGSDSRIVFGDFRLFWCFFNALYICIYLYGYKFNLSSSIKYPALFLYIASWANIAFYILGFNFQYERMNMIIGVPYIYITALMIKKKFFIYIVLSSTLFYLFLTIYQGMYTIGLV